MYFWSTTLSVSWWMEKPLVDSQSCDQLHLRISMSSVIDTYATNNFSKQEQRGCLHPILVHSQIDN